MKTLEERFWTKVSPEPNSGCWLWTAGIASNGYGVIGVGSHTTETAHRVSWRLFRGEIPDGLWVLHKCDVRQCVSPSHLYLGTAVENGSDLSERGRPFREAWKHITPEIRVRQVARLPRGAAHHRAAAKITAAIAAEIYAAAGSQRVIAQRFGLCQQSVSLIKARRRWAYIHGE